MQHPQALHSATPCSVKQPYLIYPQLLQLDQSVRVPLALRSPRADHLSQPPDQEFVRAPADCFHACLACRNLMQETVGMCIRLSFVCVDTVIVIIDSLVSVRFLDLIYNLSMAGY